MWIYSRPLDMDEAQHLHTAWRIASGEVPYRDFWDNHVPLFQILLSPLVGWMPERADVYIAGRWFSLILTLALLLAFYRVVAERGRDVAMLAVCLLAYNDIFIRKTTEIRPDTLAILLFILSLTQLAAAVPSSSRKKYLAAGFLAGGSLLASLKAVYGVGVLAAAIPFVSGFFDFSWKDRARNWTTFALGAVVPLIAAGAYLLSQGALGEFVGQVVVENFIFPDRTHHALVSEKNAFLWIGALLGLAVFLKVGGWVGGWVGIPTISASPSGSSLYDRVHGDHHQPADDASRISSNADVACPRLEFPCGHMGDRCLDKRG